MSHSFPPPVKRRPWWKFRTTAALLEDRKQYRSYLKTYNAQRAAHSVAPVKRNWLARHKILSSILGFLVFIALIAQCGEGTTATVADPADTSTAAEPAAATATPTPAPTPTGPSEAEQKAAEEKRQAEAAAKKAAEEKKRKAAVAKKKAAEKKKAAAAKKKKAAAAKKKADQEQREQEQREQEQREQDEAEEEAQEPDVYYENCDAVRAAGKAPIRVGDPGYASHLDRDGDGQGCGAD